VICLDPEIEKSTFSKNILQNVFFKKKSLEKVKLVLYEKFFFSFSLSVGDET